MINQLRALTNQIDAFAGTKLDDDPTLRLQRDIEDIVAIYENAQDATL